MKRFFLSLLDPKQTPSLTSTLALLTGLFGLILSTVTTFIPSANQQTGLVMLAMAITGKVVQFIKR